EARALEHVIEVHVATEVELVRAVYLHAALPEETGQHAMGDGGPHLALDVVTDNGQPLVLKSLLPVLLAGDKHGYAVDKAHPGLEGLLDVPLGGHLAADGQVVDHHIRTGVAKDLHDIG